MLVRRAELVVTRGRSQNVFIPSVPKLSILNFSGPTQWIRMNFLPVVRPDSLDVDDQKVATGNFVRPVREGGKGGREVGARNSLLILSGRLSTRNVVILLK